MSDITDIIIMVHILVKKQPEKGKGNRNQSKRVHEPRLVKVVQVLVDEPEHPAEEHEGNQFSQSVGHGYQYIKSLRSEPM